MKTAQSTRSLEDRASSISYADLANTARALLALTKPRLAFFSILTAMATYATGANQLGWSHALLTLLGISCSAGGALSLNQWWERDLDSLMRRTRERPLPTRQIGSNTALLWSLFLSIMGIGILTTCANWMAAAFAAATILIYGLIYTPLKRRTRWATEVGSISGALPPLIGIAAANDLSATPGWSLFLILLFWQMPHFYAIGWMYRDDYKAAGFALLSATDSEGRITGRWSFGYSIALFAVSLIPWIFGWLGLIYGIAALLAGSYLVFKAWCFMRDREKIDLNARGLFFATIRYLPVILVAIALDRML